jgi:hypothetical protein
MLLKHLILVKVFGFVVVLLVTKAGIHQFELDLVTIGPLGTAFVGGVIFIIAIILLAQKGTRPQFIVRLRNEFANIDRISNCI